MKLYEELLHTWCSALRELQVEGTGKDRLDGALMCPACGRIHGRCGDAMYPFLAMARRSGDVNWVERAKSLYEWTEATLSLPNGSVINDVDSSWDGIVVFYVAMLADCLRGYSDLLGDEFCERVKVRIGRAADYIVGYDALDQNNVNYSIGSAYALERAGSLLGVESYRDRARVQISFALECLDGSGMLFGEGVPRQTRSQRGRRPVDIGYNVEESLPILALYARETGDESLMERVRHSFVWHLSFMLPDGAWDNSFGTRKFKWSYWGSRTTDGAIVGLLLAAEGADAPVRSYLLWAARKNLELMRDCTVGGLLAGGPHYSDAGQSVCIHHSFDHAKALASVCDLGLDGLLEEAHELSANHVEGLFQPDGIAEYPDLGVALVRSGSMRATICAADWEYKPGVLTSGGMLSVLHHRELGTLLAAGMGSYRRIEIANMQMPYNVRHESLAPRIECEVDGVLWSSVFDVEATIGEVSGLGVGAVGCLRNAQHAKLDGSAYDIEYAFEADELRIRGAVKRGTLVLPLISRSCERVAVEDKNVAVERLDVHGCRIGEIVVMVGDGKLSLPYGHERVFNLVPGFQALKIEVVPVAGVVDVTISGLVGMPLAK